MTVLTRIVALLAVVAMVTGCAEGDRSSATVTPTSSAVETQPTVSSGDAGQNEPLSESQVLAFRTYLKRGYRANLEDYETLHEKFGYGAFLLAASDEQFDRTFKNAPELIKRNPRTVSHSFVLNDKVVLFFGRFLHGDITVQFDDVHLEVYLNGYPLIENRKRFTKHCDEVSANPIKEVEIAVDRMRAQRQGRPDPYPDYCIAKHKTLRAALDALYPFTPATWAARAKKLAEETLPGCRYEIRDCREQTSNKIKTDCVEIDSETGSRDQTGLCLCGGYHSRNNADFLRQIAPLIAKETQRNRVEEYEQAYFRASQTQLSQSREFVILYNSSLFPEPGLATWEKTLLEIEKIPECSGRERAYRAYLAAASFENLGTCNMYLAIGRMLLSDIGN